MHDSVPGKYVEIDLRDHAPRPWEDSNFEFIPHSRHPYALVTLRDDEPPRYVSVVWTRPLPWWTQFLFRFGELLPDLLKVFHGYDRP